MASASSQSKFMELKLCSICLATFKVPRCLPCSHSFCHQCLRSYILTTCEQRDVPLGFSCPLCREFVPSPGQPDDTGHWAENFPISDILVQLTDASEDFNVCWACRRENEEEEASDYCLTCKEPLCKLCTKFHHRNLASQNHEMCLISEIGSHNIIKKNYTTFCDRHDGRSIELYCNDHDMPCCAVCISKEHRKCDKLTSFQETAENFKKQGLMKALMYDIERMKNELREAKQNEEENALAIDDASERITKEAQQFQQEMICYLNKIMEDYLTDLAKKRKDAVKKLERSKLCISDRIDFLEYLSKVLGSIHDKDNNNAFEFVLLCNRVREKIAVIVKYPINEVTFTLSSELRDHEEFKHTLKLGSISILERSRRVYEVANIKKAKFSLISESPIVYNKVKGGIFLCNGNILCTDYAKSHCLTFLETNLENKPETAFKVGPSPWDIEADNGTLYITQDSDQTTHVQRFSENNFQALGSLDVGKSCLGITILGEHIYVVSERSRIIKRNKNGEGSPEIIYKHEKNGLRYLTSIDNEMIVFSDLSSDSVSALHVDKMGEKVWTYTHAELKCPYGLDKDPSSNIYVTGKKSNNIHILSMNGSLMRILQGISSHICIKFRKDSFTCFIAQESYSSSNSKVMVYKFV